MNTADKIQFTHYKQQTQRSNALSKEPQVPNAMQSYLWQRLPSKNLACGEVSPQSEYEGDGVGDGIEEAVRDDGGDAIVAQGSSLIRLAVPPSAEEAKRTVVGRRGRGGRCERGRCLGGRDGGHSGAIVRESEW